jgi:hypothetical protein
VSGEERGASIRVSQEQAAAGHRSLKFTDVAGLEPSWQPHTFYQPHLVEGTVRQRFDLWLGRDALVFTEWRDETAYPGCIGPAVTFDGKGQVMAGGKVLTTVPTESWVHVQIEAALGKKASKTFKLTVTPPNAAPQVFADLDFKGGDFHELHWLGFVSIATTNSIFYVDNLEIKPTAE